MKVFETKVPIYDINLTVAFGLDELSEKYPVLVQALGEDAVDLEAVHAVTWAGPRDEEEEEGTLCVLFMEDTLEENTVAHESTHLGFILCEMTGIPVTFDNQESLAYLIGWFTQTIHEFHEESINEVFEGKAEEGAGEEAESDGERAGSHEYGEDGEWVYIQGLERTERKGSGATAGRPAQGLCPPAKG